MSSYDDLISKAARYGGMSSRHTRIEVGFYLFSVGSGTAVKREPGNRPNRSSRSSQLKRFCHNLAGIGGGALPTLFFETGGTHEC